MVNVAVGEGTKPTHRRLRAYADFTLDAKKTRDKNQLHSIDIARHGILDRARVSK